MGDIRQLSTYRAFRPRFIRSISWPAFAVALSLAAAPASAQNDPQVETRLKQAIEDIRSGHPNLDQFEPMLRVLVEQQEARMSQALQSLGRVTGVEYVGPQSGTQVYKVTFDRGNSVWSISIAPSGKIQTLYFQPL